MKRLILLMAALAALSGCQGMGIGGLDNQEASTFPGIGNLDTETAEEKKDREWWDKYYGQNPNAEPDCDFYGNCKSQSKSGGWW